MSLAKKVFIAVVALLIAGLVSVVAAYKLVDDEVIENNALQALRDTLKRDVQVDGEFTLTRSFHPTLRATGVRIASADWDPDNSLLQAQTIEFGIALKDLLRGVISIGKIYFQDAVLNIKRSTNGTSNLEFTSADSSSTTPSKRKPGKNNSRFDVVDIKIDNLTVNYRDEQSELGFVYVLKEFVFHPIDEDTINITTHSQFDQQPIIIRSKMCRIRHLLRGEDCSITASLETAPFTTDIKGHVSLADAGAVNLHIESQADNINELKLIKDTPLPDTNNITLSTQLQGPFSRLSLNKLAAHVSLGDSSIDAAGSIKSINDVTGINLSLSAKAQKPIWLNQYQDVFPSALIQDFHATTAVSGDLNALQLTEIDSTLTLEDTLITLAGQADLLPRTDLTLHVTAKGKQPLWLNELQQAVVAKAIDQFSVKADVNYKNKTTYLTNLDAGLQVGSSNTTARGDVTLSEDNQLSMKLDVKSKGKNLQDFDALLQQSLPVSKQFSVSTLLALAKDTLTLDNLAVTLDETQLQGASNIALTSSPSIQADLNADTLDIGVLLGSTQSSSDKDKPADPTTNAAETTETLFSNTPINLGWLKDTDTSIALAVKNLRYKQATVNDVKANIIAKDNVATLDITSLHYQGAALTSTTIINANTHRYSHTLFTEAFDLGKLLHETDLSDTLQGKIDASINIHSVGTTKQQIASNANGKITSVMTDGTLAEAPIDLLASNLLVELMPGKSKKSNTKVECLFVQFTGENGVFTSDAVLLNTENIVMTSKGKVDLSNEKMSFLLVPKPKNIELFTLDANIRVAGALNKPSFSLDKGSVFKKLLKSAATVALGPAALAIPFTSMGGNKSEKCFSEVASVTTKAVKAEQEAERLAKEQAEQDALTPEDAQQEAGQKLDNKINKKFDQNINTSKKNIKEAVVEPLDAR